MFGFDDDDDGTTMANKTSIVDDKIDFMDFSILLLVCLVWFGLAFVFSNIILS